MTHLQLARLAIRLLALFIIANGASQFGIFANDLYTIIEGAGTIGQRSTMLAMSQHAWIVVAPALWLGADSIALHIIPKDELQQPAIPNGNADSSHLLTTGLAIAGVFITAHGLEGLAAAITEHWKYNTLVDVNIFNDPVMVHLMNNVPKTWGLIVSSATITFLGLLITFRAPALQKFIQKLRTHGT